MSHIYTSQPTTHGLLHTRVAKSWHIQKIGPFRSFDLRRWHLWHIGLKISRNDKILNKFQAFYSRGWPTTHGLLHRNHKILINPQKPQNLKRAFIHFQQYSQFSFGCQPWVTKSQDTKKTWSEIIEYKFFYRTQVSLGSDLWVLMSVSHSIQDYVQT